jgi:multiple sugar transport system permease protein
LPQALLLMPTLVVLSSRSWGALSVALLAGVVFVVVHDLVLRQRLAGERLPLRGSAGGMATLAMGALMVAQFAVVGLAATCFDTPAWAGDGLQAPQWLAHVHWAKPAIMIMGFWMAVGSNNMLLYVAALTNVPQELYEAAEIDGAGRWARFWHVTWPQLAPTTFFIVVMSCIGGLQGGFEMARTMTGGGPAGATTTLSYFVYIEGFETGRLGFASAVAWTLFLMVFVLTMFNWKFGNRYVNE